MAPDVRNKVIVYGNCQASVIATILCKDPAIAGQLRTIYLRSYNDPTQGWQTLLPEEVGDCSVLLEQHDDSRPFPYHSDLPNNCRVVRFPSLDFNLLWPFTCVNPFDEPEPPLFPFGHFPYGDRIIIQCISKNMSSEDIFEYYMTGWEDYKLDLNHLLAMEEARLTSRDRHCDVKMASATIENFRAERLFWTVNHPAITSLMMLAERLLQAAFYKGQRERCADVASTLIDYFAKDPLGAASVPVHPKIAEHYRLEWYDPKERRTSFENIDCSYEEYFRSMIKASLRFKEAQQTKGQHVEPRPLLGSGADGRL